MNEAQEEALFAFLGLHVRTNDDIEAFAKLADAFGRNVLTVDEEAYVEAIEAHTPTEPESPAEDTTADEDAADEEDEGE